MSDEEFCNARKRDGGRCRQPAGHGTGQKFGPCSKHGGNMPAHRTAAARQAVAAQAVKLGAEVDWGPHELMMTCVRQAAGALLHAQQLLAEHEGDIYDKNGRPVFALLYRNEALDRATRTSKTALDAKIAERHLQLAERWAGITTQAFEAFLRDMGDLITAERRARAVRAFEARLIAAEQGGEAIEGTAR